MTDTTQRRLLPRTMMAGALALGLIAGGYGAASAASGSGATTTPSAAAPATTVSTLPTVPPAAGSGQGFGPQRSDETPLTGDTLAKVTAAAKARSRAGRSSASNRRRRARGLRGPHDGRRRVAHDGLRRQVVRRRRRRQPLSRRSARHPSGPGRSTPSRRPGRKADAHGVRRRTRRVAPCGGQNGQADPPACRHHGDELFDRGRPPRGQPIPAARRDRGARGVAAMMVLAYHVWRYSTFIDGSGVGGTTDYVLSRLWIGLTLFFVVSGFVLYRPFARATLGDEAWPSLRRYFTHRVLRIVPGLLGVPQHHRAPRRRQQDPDHRPQDPALLRLPATQRPRRRSRDAGCVDARARDVVLPRAPGLRLARGADLRAEPARARRHRGTADPGRAARPLVGQRAPPAPTRRRFCP